MLVPIHPSAAAGVPHLLLWFPDLGVSLPQVHALQMTASFMTLVFCVSCQIL